MESALKILAHTGAIACGSVSYDRIAGRMDAGLCARAEAENPGLQNLLCAAYPYEGPGKPGNVALYARGADYHIVVKQRLGIAAGILRARYSGRYFHPYTDTSPFPEVYAAACAGLGVIGRNGLLITQWGSYVLLGFLATDLPMTDRGLEPDFCAACDACLHACPTGALGKDGLDPEKCLSAITQKRGSLQREEQTAVRRGGLIWGCDICQTCCPLNKAPAPPLPELAPKIFRLTEEDVALGDTTFREQFKEYAFTWRGVQPLRRNLEILSETPETLLSRAFRLFTEGRTDEAEALYNVCAAELQTDDPMWRTLWQGRIYLLCEQGRFSEAENDARALLARAATPEERQVALHQLGMVFRRAGDLTEAERCFARELEELNLLAPSLISRAANGYERGYIALKRRDLDAAEQLLLFALRDARLSKDFVCLGCVYRGLAELSLAHGRLTAVKKRLARAKNAFLRAGDRRGATEIDALRAEYLAEETGTEEEKTDG